MIGAAVIIVAALINTWLGVAVAVIAFVGARLVAAARAGAGCRRSAAAGRLGDAAGNAPRARRRAAGHGDRHRAGRRRAARRCAGARLDGGVADRSGGRSPRRREATAAALEARLPGARVEVGANDPALAVEDALRVFGADEVLVVGDDGMLDAIRERVAIPVGRAS